MLISEVPEERRNGNGAKTPNPSSAIVWGRKRHPVVARFLAALGIMWHAVRHPLTAGIINLDTGEVKPLRD